MRISGLGRLTLNFLPFEKVIPHIVEFHGAFIKRVERTSAVALAVSPSKNVHFVVYYRAGMPISFLGQNSLNLLVQNLCHLIFLECSGPNTRSPAFSSRWTRLCELPSKTGKLRQYQLLGRLSILESTFYPRSIRRFDCAGRPFSILFFLIFCLWDIRPRSLICNENPAGLLKLIEA